MNTATQTQRHTILRWMQEFSYLWNESPKTVPISRAELERIIAEEPMHMTVPMMDTKPKLFGVEVEETDFGDSLRIRRLLIPVSQYLVEYPVRESLGNNSRILLEDGMRRIESIILNEKTRVQITLEWDVFATLKRRLHLTRWWPIRTVKTTIECAILYPYCKVSLPHNRHTFRASLADKPHASPGEP